VEIDLPGGYTIRFTGSRVLKPDGSRNQGIGVVPTIRVSRTVAGIAAGRDEVLDKGLEVLRGRAGK
jgi:C-terminal processing protease CtpA/Prc